MRTPVLLLIALTIGMAMNDGCMSAPTEHMSIEKQVKLSPGHQTMPYRMTRASNGDLVIFGSIGQVDYRPWATRLTPNGEVRWEFLEGGPDGWNDQSAKGQRFDSAIELPDQTMLFCGIKVVNKERLILLDRIGIDGSLKDERVIRPDRQKSSITGFDCVRWNDGIALIGGVSGYPAGTGWLAKLDWQLNLQWQKFDDQYVGAHAMEAADGGFFYINTFVRNPNGSKTSLLKLGPTGEIIARHALSDDASLVPVYPIEPRSDVRLALKIDTLKTEIIDLDDQLQGPTRVIKLHNAGVNKCLELRDGSIAIFGSQFHNGATAAITRVYKDGSSKGFVHEPPYESPWYYDAVVTGKKNEFAATRSVGLLQAVLEWISFN